MNRIEFRLGVSVVVLSVLSILVIASNTTTVVVDSLGERFAFTMNARASFFFIALIFVAGIVAVATYQGTRLGFVLGSAILLWSPFAVFLVMLTLTEPFLKGSFADEFLWVLCPLIVFTFLGIGLAVDGICAHASRAT